MGHFQPVIAQRKSQPRKRMKKFLLTCCLLSLSTVQLVKADQPEAVASNIIRLPDAWTSGVQINQLTFNEAEAKHHRHKQGKIGITQSSINARFARGGTDDSPETAVYASINRYQLYGREGHHIEPKPHYLPFLGLGGFWDQEDTFRLNYLVGVQFNVNHWNLFTSTRYVGMLAGRSPIGNFGIDYGVYILTGLRKTQAYPLVGFDYQYGKWTFKAIYPLEISLRYAALQSLTLIATTRWNNDRFRLSKAASRKNGFVQYDCYGLELGLEWTFLQRYKLGLSVGTNTNATVATYNRRGHKVHHHRLDQALYSQINLSCAI